MDEELISSEELTAYLFTIQDMRRDLRVIRNLIGGDEDDGELGEDDA